MIKANKSHSLVRTETKMWCKIFFLTPQSPRVIFFRLSLILTHDSRVEKNTRVCFSYFILFVTPCRYMTLVACFEYLMCSFQIIQQRIHQMYKIFQHICKFTAMIKKYSINFFYIYILYKIYLAAKSAR